jgi:hypothetical protein
MNPREQAQAITDAAGIQDGGKTTEAFTRFFRRGSRTGWGSLTQDDFAMIEDAFADAAGRPRRKRKNNLIWKIGYWWHWHVTSPLDDGLRWLGWHLLPGKCRIVIQTEDASYGVDETSWIVAQSRIRRTRRRHPAADIFAGLYGFHIITMPDESAATAYRIRYGPAADDRLPLHWRIAARLGRLHSGWDWCCPDCGIDFGAPDDTTHAEAVATEGLNAHVAEDHAGAMPGECGVTQLFWTRRGH